MSNCTPGMTPAAIKYLLVLDDLCREGKGVRSVEIAARMKELLTRCDAVITSGGVSVGQKDYLPTVLEMLHAEPVFAGVAQKPGSPMIAAQVGEKLVFCLSGNPFAAAATLEQYAVPALLRAAGRREEDCVPVHTRGRLTTGFSKPSKGTRFLRARALGGLVEIPGEGNAEAKKWRY